MAATSKISLSTPRGAKEIAKYPIIQNPTTITGRRKKLILLVIKPLLLGFAYLRVEKVDWLSFSFKSLNQKGNEYVNQSSIPYARNLRVSL
jgi:hypothetical protein